MKIIFMGTPDFAVAALDALCRDGQEVILAVTQPDRQKGRGRKVIQTPVKICAEKWNVPVFQLKDLRIRKTHCGPLSGNRSIIRFEQYPRRCPVLVILAHNVPYPGPLSAFQPPVIDHHEQSVLQPFYAWIAWIFLIVRKIAANSEFLRPYGMAEVGHGLQHALKLATDVGSGNDLAPVHLHHRMEYDTLFRLRCR